MFKYKDGFLMDIREEKVVDVSGGKDADR